jgi:prevent-host-death family protein
MNTTINAKELRASLPQLVARVRKGARYTVIYRSRPAFQIVPVDDSEAPAGALEDDSLFEAAAVGRSEDGRSAADHDSVLYGR